MCEDKVLLTTKDIREWIARRDALAASLKRLKAERDILRRLIDAGETIVELAPLLPTAEVPDA